MNILGSISLLILMLTIVCAYIVFRKKKTNFMYVLVVGVFLSILFMMLIIDYKPYVHGRWSTVFLALFHSIQVMLAGYEFDLIYDFVETGVEYNFFIFPYMPLLFFVGPVCTFGFVISFFKNFLAHLAYAAKFFRDIYIFSDISTKSLALAESIRKKFPKATIVFAQSNTLPEEAYELNENERKIQSIFLKKDIKDMGLKFHSKKSKVCFVVIKEDESENLEDAVALIEKFENRENTELFVFSNSKESEILLDSVPYGKMKVRRINTMRSLAYSIIANKLITEDFKVRGDEKIISTLIIGMGGYGTELVKALLWCGQLPGYSLEINIIDKNPLAQSLFTAQCPEIMKLNGNKEIGEARYNIKFYNGIDVNSDAFAAVVSKLDNTTMVYVSLGNDGLNIETAMNSRIILERIGIYPKIRTVVYSDIRAGLLRDKNLINFKKESYDIEIIGNTQERYSYDNMVNEELEKTALKCHYAWAVENDKLSEEEIQNIITEETNKFNEIEYYRNSSLATAIHQKYRVAENLSGEVASLFEHMRWNAYMRTEGYVFSGSMDSSSRNDRAKMHHNLHKAELLDENSVNKDQRVVGVK